MKLNTSLSILTVAFILSLSGFIISVVMPQNNFSDKLMIAALFSGAASGIIASVFTKKLAKSKQWNYVVIGGLILLLSYPVKIMDFLFLNNILKVTGGVIFITTLGYYIYLNRSDFRNSRWIWFIPFILLGCLLRYMYWPGGNIIIFSCLMIITVKSIIQLSNYKKHTRVELLLLVWQIAMCGCIAVFYFRYIKVDSFIIGFIFILLALVDILLQNEKKENGLKAFNGSKE
ncbi:MAG: hypothetical protein ABI723_15850 [Bacteroidia bacterium]